MENPQRRKSDTGNKQLPPSERWVNRAKALATAWPVVVGLVGMLGYTNKDHIASAFSKESQIPAGETVSSKGAAPESWAGTVDIAIDSHKVVIDKHSDEISALEKKLEQVEARQAALRKKGDSALEERVSALESLVQP